jgi:hypothetical protein
VIKGRGRVKRNKRCSINDAARYLQCTAFNNGERDKKNKTGNAKKQAKTVRQGIGDLFNGQFF